MSVPEYHEAVFRWPHPEANTVIVTGQFDAWSGTSHHLSRVAGGFEGTVQVPWGTKFQYKYIVDGRWTTTDDQPTELDSIGNLNNVYDSPARPAPPPSMLAPVPESVEYEQPAGQVNGVLDTAKAVAPGTTQTSAEAHAETTETEKNVTIDAEEAKSAVAEPLAEPTSETTQALQGAPVPKEEIAPEAVLPEVPQDATTAPIVPITVLPLTSETEAPATNGHVEKPVENGVAEGTALTGEPEPAVEASTPAPLAGDTETVTSNGTLVEASTHGPAVTAEKSEVSAKPTEIALPPPTPGEVPLPSTPPTNGKAAPSQPSSQTTTPTSSPRKEKRIGFPTFGRHHRHSSSASVASHGTDEHGVVPDNPSPSRMGSQKKKRTSSIFGKLKGIFADEHHKEKK